MSINSTYVFPTEGIDYMMSVIPKGGAVSGTIYLGLWGNNTSTWSTLSGYATAGNINITLNTGTYPITEQATFSGYGTRVALTNSNWSTQSGTTINVTGNSALPVRFSNYNGGVTITNSGATTVSGIAGIFLAIGPTAGTVGSASGPSASTVLWYAPFTDLLTVNLETGDSITVTPTWQTASFQS
jgi:hypothetical protein